MGGALLQGLGEGPAVASSHGWLRSSDAGDGQMLFRAPHGFTATHQDQVNADLLAFLRS